MKFLTLSLLLSIPFFLQAQSPYNLSWKKDLPAILAGNTLTLSSFLLAPDPLTVGEVATISSGNILAIDKTAIENFSEAADRRSDIGLLGGYALSLGSTLVLPAVKQSKGKQFWKEVGTLALIWYETNASVSGVTLLTKSLVRRKRPFVYNDNAPLADKLEVDARYSFFSGHTSFTAANFFMLGKFYSDYFPKSKYKPLVWMVVAVIPAWTGIERFNAGKHFLTDVFTGYAVGALLGYYIPHWHKKKDRKVDVSFYPFSTQSQSGIGFQWRF
ncbi:MAG: phosphatase PAP2 family protein [Bacteroidota bacterium]